MRLPLLIGALGPWSMACESSCPSIEDGLADLEVLPHTLRDEVGLLQTHQQINSIRSATRQHDTLLWKPEQRFKSYVSDRWQGHVQSFQDWANRLTWGCSEAYSTITMTIMQHIRGRVLTYPSHLQMNAEGFRSQSNPVMMTDGGKGVPVGMYSLIIFGMFMVVLLRCVLKDAFDSTSGKGSLDSNKTGLQEFRWWHIAILLQLDLMSPLAQDSYMPSMPVMVQELGTSETKMGMTLQIGWVVSGLFGAILGMVSDKYGRRPVLLTALGFYVMGSLGCALSWDISSLMLARCLQSVGCSCQVFSYTITRDVIQDADDRAKIIATFLAAGPLAMVLSPIVFGLVSVFLGWRMIFIVIAALGLQAFWAVNLFFPETNSIITAQHERKMEEADEADDKILVVDGNYGPIVSVLLRSWKPVGLAISCWMSFGYLLTIIGSIAFVLQGAYGAEIFTIAACTAIFAVGATVGGILGMVLTSQCSAWQVTRLGTCGLLFAGGAMFLIGLFKAQLTLFAFMTPLVLYTIFAICVLGPLSSLAAQPFGAAAGTAIGLQTALQFPMGALFSFIATWVFQSLGVYAWMMFLGILAAFNQLAYWGFLGTFPDEDPVFEITEGYKEFLKSKGKGKGK